MTSPSSSGYAGRTPSCEWSVMSSSDPWSCGSRRRRDERGPFIAAQRTMHQVPHVFPAAASWTVSESWFYKWPRARTHRPAEVRRGELDAAVKTAFDASGGTYGSPRIHADLLEDGVGGEREHRRRLHASARLARAKPKHRKGLTKQDATAAKFPDLLHRDFTAAPAMCAAYECGEILVIAPRGAVTCQGRGARCTTKATPRWLVLSAPRKSSPHLRLSPRRL